MTQPSHGADWQRGVYAITPTTSPTAWPPARLLTSCETVLAAGVALLQIRDKPIQRPELAAQLATLCEHYQTPLIVNDDVALAEQLGCGVHVGSSDAAITEARQALGPDAIIGASVYNSVDAARLAVEQGASYVSFGRFFSSSTKPNAPAADLATLRSARQLLDVPISAIGGITPHNAPPLIDAGADLVCAVASIFDADDPAQAVGALNACFADVAPAVRGYTTRHESQ